MNFTKFSELSSACVELRSNLCPAGQKSQSAPLELCRFRHLPWDTLDLRNCVIHSNVYDARIDLFQSRRLAPRGGIKNSKFDALIDLRLLDALIDLLSVAYRVSYFLHFLSAARKLHLKEGLILDVSVLTLCVIPSVRAARPTLHPPFEA